MISKHRKAEKHHKEIKGKWAAIATVVGTIIGAGFLGLPYVVSKAGFLVGVGYIILLGLVMLLINLYFGEVILRTRKIHQIPGYAGRYLGKKGEVIAFIALFFGMYSAMIAYFIAEGESLSFLFLSSVSTSAVLIFGSIFFILISYLNHRGLKALKKYEFIGFILILLIILSIVIMYAPSIKPGNLSGFSSSFIFLPFGVILFAYLGIEALTEAKMILKNNKKMKSVIIWSSIIPIIFYLVFSFVVVGSFDIIPEIATLALGKVFVFLGILTVFTSSFSISIIIKDAFILDMGLSKRLSWFLSIIVPYLLFLIIVYFGWFGFVSLLGLGGSITGGLLVILVLIMNKNAKSTGKRKPEFKVKINWLIITILSLIFLAGMVYSLVKFVI